MKSRHRLFRVPWIGFVLGLTILACNSFSQSAISQAESTQTAGITPSDTATAVVESPSAATATITETFTPSETETPPAPTIPPFLTSIPGIAATLTAVASTPGAQKTLAAQQTMVAATEAVQFKQLSILLTPCKNPSDPPMQNWVNIPVMPQATAGQVVQTLIGTYYCFRAPVTVEVMESFYKEKLPPPDWVLQGDVNGTMEFIGISQAGFQNLFLVSGPGNKNDLIVAINVTRPLAIPTQKP